MKLLNFSAIFFLLQTVFLTAWYAIGVQTDTEQVKNFKFFSWMVSLITTIVFFVLIAKRKSNSA